MISGREALLGILGIKKKDSHMVFVESTEYAKDHREESLHKIVERDPKLVALETGDGGRLPTIVIGSHLGLPTSAR